MAKSRQEYFKKRYETDPERFKAAQRAYAKANPEKERTRKQRWAKLNKDKLRVRNREYIRHRRKTDPKFALRLALRERVNKFLKTKRLQGNVTAVLGCSWSTLYEWLESKFQPGMTWENHGLWHIDHIKPLSLFDLTDPNQFASAGHYTNLQPLWAVDNLRKSNKLV